jgi:hypothetical protein
MRSVKLLLLLALLSAGCFAQSVVCHLTYQANNTNSSSCDTTGATLFIINTTCFTANTVPNTPTDSSSNTYTGLTYYGGTNNGVNGKLYYVFNPTTSSTQTWKRNGNCSTTGRDFVIAFSGTGTSIDSGTDQGLNAGALGTSTIIPNITPNQSGDLIVTGYSNYCASPAGTVASSPSSTYTITDHSESAATSDGAIAYTVYSSSSTISITWSWAGGCSPNSAAYAVGIVPPAAPSGSKTPAHGVIF